MDQNIYDVIILGTGPAGLQAAIHAARRGRWPKLWGRAVSQVLLQPNMQKK